MRLLWTAYCLIALFPITTSAQPSDSPVDAGARALLFQVSSSPSFGGFGGASISAKWHASASAARRLGLTVDGALVESEDLDQQRVDIAFDFLFLSYRRSRTPIYLYHGFGPTGAFRLNRNEPATGGTSRSLRTSLGVAAVLGVEWIVHPAIGLVGEYGTGLLLTYGQRQIGSDEYADEYGVALQARGARVGISVYF